MEVTVAIISSSDQKSWTEDNFFFSVNSSLRLSPGISFESGEAVSGKSLFPSWGLNPYFHIPGECCVDTWQHFLATPVAEPRHSLTWWYFLPHLVAYQFMAQICTYQFDGFTFVACCPLICIFILQIKKIQANPPNSSCRGWSRANLKSFEGCCFHIMNFQPFANCSFLHFFVFSMCVEAIFFMIMIFLNMMVLYYNPKHRMQNMKFNLKWHLQCCTN